LAVRRASWREHTVATGGGLVLHTADRRDQIFFKLYASIDLKDGVGR